MKKIVATVLTITLFLQSFGQSNYYTNPVLAGFYPDPGICRAGDDYYLVNSSFSYYPGLPIFHSKDLVNWKQIGNAMNRPEQLNLDGAGVSRGLFAPDITYHKGTFYIVCTLIDRLGNFVITAKDPKGPWSNPVALTGVNGIDPSLFFDDNDKAYIVFNSIPPGNKSLYDGHRTIRMFELNAKDLKITGEEKLLVNGGTDITKKPVWIEGPHIFKKEGWYYLICAEGGTGYNHSEVVFRSKSPGGPFVSYEKNPILTQRHLDPARKDPVTTTGHAGFVQTKNGKWYAVFLGCRPYEDDYYNTGRETFMAPVIWEDGWPTILKGNEEVQYHYPVPMPSLTKTVANSFSGNAFYRDDFNRPQLNNRFIFLRTVRSKWYDLSEKKGWLALQLRPETCLEKKNPSFVAHRQQNLQCSATTSILFSARSDNEKAGLAIFQNEVHFYYLCLSMENNKPVVQLYQSTKDSSMQWLASAPVLPGNKEIQLKIEARKDSYAFFYALDDHKWKLLKDGVDGKFLSTKVAGGFTGSVFALYATSSGKETVNKAYFNWFEYKGDDEVYKH
ncbi:MAG: glycoside hydrolase family 43 protein [Bacteroidota bacterium]|nr:glycoside hydrolase family 43 protein [Bacteroidota bacterium]